MNEESLQYHGWRVATASGVGVFFATLFVFTFAVLLRALVKEFEWSREAISSAYGAMTLASAFAAPVMGQLVDRWGPRWIVGPSLMLGATAFASLSVLSPHLWHLYLVYLVIGVAISGTSPVVYSRVISNWFDRRRGTALSVMVASAGVGAIVYPPAIERLMASTGWRGACLVLGVIILAVGVPTVARVVREPHGHSARADTSVSAIPIGRALRSRVFWTLLAVVFGTTLATNGVIVHLSAMMIDRGLSSSQAITVMSTMGVASLAGRLLTGWLLDRFNAIRVLFVLLTIAALGAYLLADASSFLVGAIAAVCIGFGTGGEVDVVPYLLSRYFGIRSLATLFGVIWMAFGLAGAAGPILMGRAFDSTGSYGGVLIGLAAGVMAAAALMLTLPAYRSRVGAASVA